MKRSRQAPSFLLLLFLMLLVVWLALSVGCGSEDPSGAGAVETDETGSTAATTEPAAPTDTSAESDPSDDGSQPDETPGGDAPTTLELTAEDNGGSFTVAEGGTISLALRDNPSTGYMWELELDDPEASLLEQSREPSFVSDNPDAAGAGGITTYTFRAAGTGEMIVRMVFIPPDGGEPTDVFEVTLTVE